MMLLLVAMCWCREKIYIPSKFTFLRILHRNRAQNIIQCHDNNIWKQMCIKKYLIVLRPIFDTTYKGKKQVEIYMWALHHELVLFLQSRNFFAMYQIIRSKGTSWAGPRHEGSKWKQPGLNMLEHYSAGAKNRYLQFSFVKSLWSNIMLW